MCINDANMKQWTLVDPWGAMGGNHRLKYFFIDILII